MAFSNPVSVLLNYILYFSTHSFTSVVKNHYCGLHVVDCGNRKENLLCAVILPAAGGRETPTNHVFAAARLHVTDGRRTNTINTPKCRQTILFRVPFMSIANRSLITKVTSDQIFSTDFRQKYEAEKYRIISPKSIGYLN